jgi:cobalt-zinc-cadmium efflux system protein
VTSGVQKLGRNGVTASAGRDTPRTGPGADSPADESPATDNASRTPHNVGRAFIIGIVLNTVFIVLEAFYGVLSNSTALLADAGHNLSDVLGLLIAWGAVTLSRRPPTATFTYGLGASSLLAALFNAVFLLAVIVAIAWGAMQRFAEPEPIEGVTVMIVAGIGIVINGVTAVLLAPGRKSDIGIEGAYLHMASDAAVSLGVVLAALAYVLTGWTWVDPAASLAICGVIFAGTCGLLRNSVRMLLKGVPESIDPAAVRGFLLSQPGVERLSDLHIWSVSTVDIALSCRLTMPGPYPGDGFLEQLAEDLRRNFAIGRVSVQIETGEQPSAALSSMSRSPAIGSGPMRSVG